jgi:hypothetical protein
MEENKSFVHEKFIYTEQGIEYPNSIKFPRYLFKYYSFNDNSVDAFVSNYLYFSHPSQFNDIMDASDLLLNFENCSEENYNDLYEYRIGNYNFERDKIPNYEDAKKDKFIDLRVFIYFLRFFHKGILSLTTHPFNKLMMAHYTSETGFVLEFEPNILMNFLKDQNENKSVQLFPMNYSKIIERINYFKESQKTTKIENGTKINELDGKIPFLYLSYVKDKVWKYENEWRILIDRDNMGHIAPPLDFRRVPEENIIKDERKIKYNFNCFNKIILAPMFFNNLSFKAEIKNFHNNRVYYSLNIEFLQQKGLLSSMRNFLTKICSKELQGKVFIQLIECNNLKNERCCIEVLNLDFLNDATTFSYGKECISFGKTQNNKS